MESLMALDNNPVFGRMQPSNGSGGKLNFAPISRRRKTPIEPDAAQRNIAQRLGAMFPRATGATQQYEQLAKLSGVGAETIRRFMNGDSSMTLRNLSAIAEAISLTLPELFTDPIAARKAVPAADTERGNGGLQRG